MTPTQRKAARTIIRRYLERAEANKADIHYDQARPTDLSNPDGEFTTDCSGLVINAFHWADMWTSFKVIDPSGFHYSGWGNTTSILATNKKRRVPLDRKFFVGDMALFGPYLGYTKHVIICKKNGTRRTALWTSHGSEPGPYEVKLDYRSDLLVVVRAESLA